MQKVMNDYNSRTDKPEERICELKESLEKKITQMKHGEMKW